MQQFVGQSPWEWQPVWERLARRMVKELEPDAVWVIDDTGAPDITEEGFRVLELIEAERQEQIRSGGQQQQESRARTS